MAQVMMNMPPDSLDRSSPSASASASLPSPPADDDDVLRPPPPHSSSSSRRKERDFRDRRDNDDNNNNNNNRDFGNRHPNNHRRGGDYYYDRNISPPPPPHLHRDRDFKRRRSPSRSPSYRDHHRRYSPPPPYKRSRRGSPRGGYGPDDRLGYDYFGGYERGVGGRLGYGDERSYGRFAHRSTELESNRANVVLPSSGSQREGLMSYKQFIQELEDDILPAEAEHRYQEYKSEYISTQKRAYFNAHKDKEWLRDKYHPTNLVAVIDRRNENARRLAKDFFHDLQNGALDINPGLNTSPSNPEQTSEANSEDEADTGGKQRQHGRRPNKENDISAAPKAHPISSESRRIQADVEQAQALVRKLDAEKGIKDNILCSSDHNKNEDKSRSGSFGPTIIVRGLTSVKGLEGVELLDTILTYLWGIHGVDYYGMIETNEPKGLRHVRPEKTGHEESSKSGSEWAKKLDLFWQERLSGQDPLEIMTAREKIDATAVEGLDPYVRKIRDEKYGWKYGCGAKGCTKLFHAAEFVHKHLKLKHPELTNELTLKVREDLYFQNYMNDRDAPGGTPIMQQQQKDKPLRRRLPLEGRLRDDRGNLRDHERSERMNDGDRLDNSPSREMGNHDETMYDSYAGAVVPPFTSDMPPPPVLMPLPGAGPLGPFVPAPPEVAMQMFREQGGASSYDASGRKMRPGPHTGGPTPIIAVPPAFRPDPRRMRSYQDLDAPEDEVTVIDYRSL